MSERIGWIRLVKLGYPMNLPACGDHPKDLGLSRYLAGEFALPHPITQTLLQ